MKVRDADLHRLARADYVDRARILDEILHPERKVEPKPDADGVIQEPGKVPVMPFQKIESLYESDDYPKDVRYSYVALEQATIRFQMEFEAVLNMMTGTPQPEVILEILQKHKDYLASLEAALAENAEQTA